MPTINSKACVVNGTPVDKVYSDGKQVYGRNLLAGVDRTIKQSTSFYEWIANINQKYIKVGEPLCFSLFISNSPHARELGKGIACCIIQAKDSYGQILLEKKGNDINFDADGISQASIVIPL